MSTPEPGLPFSSTDESEAAESPTSTEPPVSPRRRRRGSAAFAPATPLEKAKQRREIRRPLLERTTIETNLAEYPIWALNKKDQYPTTLDPRGGLDPKTGKPKRVPDLPRFKRLHELTTATARGTVIRRVEVSAGTDHGFPNIVGLELFIYLCEVAQEMGFSSPFIPFTYYAFAKRTRRNPSGKTISSIRRQLHALYDTKITFWDAWSEHPTPEQVVAAATSSPGEAITAPRPVFLKERLLRIVDGASILAPKRAGLVDAIRIVQTDEPPDAPESYVLLGKAVFRNLAAGARFGIDADYLFALPTDVSKRAYVLLTKRDDRKREYHQDLLNFCERIGLKTNRSAEHAWQQIKPHLDELTKPILGTKVFLEKVWLGPKSAAGRDTIWFRFADATPADADTSNQRMHEYLKARVRPDTYDKFFAGVCFTLQGNGGVETVLVVHQFRDHYAHDFFVDNYREFITDTVIPEVFGKAYRPVFVQPPPVPASTKTA